MKLAPLVRALEKRDSALIERNISWRIVHTGQHYDPGMNDVFFKELGIPKPDVHLDVGSGSQGSQTARMIERYESHLLKTKPAATVVFGDVNSTTACALAAVKLQIPVIHVEAGLRSFDRTMPEEINRTVTDVLADLLLVSEPSGLENLRKEGIADNKVHLVGNVMIDTLVHELKKAKNNDIARRLELSAGNYGLVTLHRPSNVDDPKVLSLIIELLCQFSTRLPLVFPVHPRTEKAIKNDQLQKKIKSVKSLKCISPLPYHDNLCLMAGAKVVLTDSGGMQEETTYLGVPCLTLRENTERPITVTQGTSRLVGNNPDNILQAFEDALNDRWPKPKPISLWDGHAAERIADILLDHF